MKRTMLVLVILATLVAVAETSAGPIRNWLQNRRGTSNNTTQQQSATTTTENGTIGSTAKNEVQPVPPPITTKERQQPQVRQPLATQSPDQRRAATVIPVPTPSTDGTLPTIRDTDGRLYYLITPTQYRNLVRKTPTTNPQP